MKAFAIKKSEMFYALVILDRNFASIICKKLFIDEIDSFEFYFSILNEYIHNNEQVVIVRYGTLDINTRQ